MMMAKINHVVIAIKNVLHAPIHLLIAPHVVNFYLDNLIIINVSVFKAILILE